MMKPYIKYTFGLIFRQKKTVIFLIVLVLVETAIRLIQPFFYKILVDTLTQGMGTNNFSNQAASYIVTIMIAWFIVAVLDRIISSQTTYLGWNIGTETSQQVHVEGFKQLLKMDYQTHTQKHSSQHVKIVDDADTAMYDMTVWWLNRFYPSIVGFIGMLIVAFTVSWQMTLVSLAIIPFGFLMIIFVIKRYENEQHYVNKLWTEKHENLSDQISNIVTYKLNSDEDYYVDIQRRFSRKAHDAQSKLNRKWRLVDMLNPDILARFLVMGTGVFLVKNGSITLGTLFMFTALLNEILVPMNLLGDILPQYSRKARYMDKYLQLLNGQINVVDPENAEDLSDTKGKIEFKNVFYDYSGIFDKNNLNKKYTINDLNFTINEGEHIALVGHSGAGKSTVMALITRLVDPVAGTIFLDEIDIKHFKQADYRKLIGTVLQENSLYNQTISKNISYGRPHATFEEIIEAAKKAAADEFIQKLPNGYSTIIGERGVRLSGGEKQRLAIARAILKDPKIVVLDEPTSALDSITEAKVQKGLEALIKGRTSITVAHRLSTVKDADKILFLRGGELIAMGNHAELMKTSEEYKQMVELQTGGFLADEVHQEQPFRTAVAR